MTTSISRPRRIVKQSILIWVDTNVDSNNADTKETLEKLHDLVDDIELIKTPESCLELLEEVEPTKCHVITSGSFSKKLVPLIHSIQHVESIFVFCENKTYHEQWASEWTKIRGVHTSIKPICEWLRPIIKQVKNDDIAMSIMTNDTSDQMDPKQLPPSFLYSSMLKDVFLIMNFKREHFNKMIKKLLKNYQGNNKETRFISEFSKDYRPDTAIWWYTRQCFTYTDVNASLRTLNADMIVDLAPFIVDLHKQIKELYEQQLHTVGRNSFTVYRGQGMAKDAFQNLSQSKHGLLSFDCFLSTSKQRSVSLPFAEGGATRPEHVGVLFVINIDPTLRVVPFAHIKEHSFYPDEDEVLFSMHSIFKIGQVQTLTGHTNLFEVQLQLTEEDDPKLLGLKKHISGQAVGVPEHSLGWILHDMGEYDKREEIYLDLLEKETNERDKGLWNHELGNIKLHQGGYEEAIKYYQMALEIKRRVLSEDDPSIAATYNCIGQAYNQMGKYSEALGYYTKANDIFERVLPKNHPNLATSYNNIGNVYREMGDYKKALESYEKSLEIDKETLPENHPDIGTSYHNMGLLFYNMKKYKQALEYFEKARRIRMISLPPTHPKLKLTIDWIEKVKKEMN